MASIDMHVCAPPSAASVLLREPARASAIVEPRPGPREEKVCPGKEEMSGLPSLLFSELRQNDLENIAITKDTSFPFR